MRPNLATLAAGLAVVALLGPHSSAVAIAADVLPLRDAPKGTDAAALWERAGQASSELAYRATVVIVNVGAPAPTVTELEISQSGGMVQIRDSDHWTIGSDPAGGFMWDESDGELLRIGNVAAAVPDTLSDKYDVAVAGVADLDTGPATVLAITQRDSGVLRERLHVDQASDLVVRRETFEDGEPWRIVAFTDLLIDVPMAGDGMPARATAEREPMPLSDRSLEVLQQVGWAVPQQLPGAFTLTGAYALPDESSSLHLVYSDGLYRLSIFEQPGRMDASGLDGAVREHHASIDLWRWPGAEPERIVWSSPDRTFTAITDAPLSLVVEAVGPMPKLQPRGLGGRIVHGASRLLDLLWPF